MANNMTYRFTVTKRGVVPDLLKALVVMALRETDLCSARRAGRSRRMSDSVV
jgi:hypothetical protein